MLSYFLAGAKINLALIHITNTHFLFIKQLVSLAERLKAVIAAGVLEQSEGVDNGIDLGTIPTVDGATTKAGEFSQNAGKEENVVDEAIAVGKANNGVVRIDELRPNNEELFDGGKTQQKREHSSEAELSDPDEV